MKRDGKHFCLRDRVEVEGCEGEGGVFVCFLAGGVVVSQMLMMGGLMLID